jgi:3-methylcrotonyl-CoA carboxylase alpha subunit
VRVDSGVREGDAISPYYDPMIAKLIVWGSDRKQALARMAQALAQYQIVGLAANIAFLKRLVESEAFANADLDTGLIERNKDALFPPARSVPVAALALATVALIEQEKDESAAQSGRNGGDPWGQALGWRMNARFIRTLSFTDENGKEYQPCFKYLPHGWELTIKGIDVDVGLMARDGVELSIKLGDTSVQGCVRRDGEAFHVFVGGGHHTLRYNDPLAHAGEVESEGGRLTAPMPGKVVAVLAKQGQDVKKGEPLVIMEAMKMEHTIAAPHDGTVDEVLYAVGDQVTDGAPLLAFRAAA